MAKVQVDSMNRTSKELIPDGNAADQPDSDFDPKQLAMGVKVEMEHTKNKALAKEVAKDHLAEIPDYYTKLIKMEREASTLPPIIQEIKRSLRRDRFADMDEFPEVFGNEYDFNIDRFRRHDHGGGDDGDDWLPSHEIDADFNEGKRKHKHQIDLVNKMLKEAGYEPNAEFDLGEKGHFSIRISLKETDTKKVKKMLKGGAYPMAPEPKKINLKERWDNKEWNKLDGAPEEDVLTQPLRSRKDYGESMKVSSKLKKIAASLRKSGAYGTKLKMEDISKSASSEMDGIKEILDAADKHFGNDYEEIDFRSHLLAIETVFSPKSPEGKKFVYAVEKSIKKSTESAHWRADMLTDFFGMSESDDGKWVYFLR